MPEMKRSSPPPPPPLAEELPSSSSSSGASSSWPALAAATLLLLALSSSLATTATAFAPPVPPAAVTRNVNEVVVGGGYCRQHDSPCHHHRRRAVVDVDAALSSAASSLSYYEKPSTSGSSFRLGTRLFARGPGRPPKSAAIEEEEVEDDEAGVDLDYDDDDDEEGEGEEDLVGVDVEIGNEDDYEEEDEEDIEYEYDEEEELEEEFYDDDADEEEGTLVAGVEGGIEDETLSAADVWASYDAVNEDAPAPLSDDVFPDDESYHLAMKAALSQVEERKAMRERDAVVPRSLKSPDEVARAMEYIVNGMTDEEKAMLDDDADLREVEEIVSKNDMLLAEEDLKDVLVEDDDGNLSIDPRAVADAGSFDDDRGIDAFPSSNVAEDGENLVYPADADFSEKDLVDLDEKISAYKAARESFANQTFYGAEHTMAYMDVERDWPRLSNETQDEILDVLENSNTMACPEPEVWLMYDLGFNVSNLILASFKHNPEAPIMFTQWMPQLEVYERYADQRARDFKWTWDDVEQADMGELERYYRGIGYDEVPRKDSSETGVITLDESPMDDEEREMLALENWMDEVYDEETDNLLFDDESFEPRDNVYDPDFGTSSSDKSAALEEKFMKEYEAFEREFSEETQEWRDQYATVEKFEYREDPEGQKKFRGHLVVACANVEDDLNVADQIVERFEAEFDKAVLVETRVLGHARAEDNVFEVWLESYEVDLLHSRRQAFVNAKLWNGPSDVDDAQLEYLVERVRYLISDDTRYSYRMSDYSDVQA